MLTESIELYVIVAAYVLKDRTPPPTAGDVARFARKLFDEAYPIYRIEKEQEKG